MESVITMSKLYGCLPSEILGIEDNYTAFCFNEACAYICSKLLQDEKPMYRTEHNTGGEKKKYSSFSSFYRNIK